MLEEQGYDYLEIHNNNELVSNLRKQLEVLNNYTFTDNEWAIFFNKNIANNNDGIIEKTKKIQEDYIQVLKKEDGTVKTNGTDIEKILPPMRRFGGGNRTQKKQAIIEKILKFFEKYFGIIGNKENYNFMVINLEC